MHEQRGALAAEVGVGRQRDAFLLRRQRHQADALVGAAQVDEAGVAGVGDVGHQRDAVRLEYGVDVIGPVG